MAKTEQEKQIIKMIDDGTDRTDVLTFVKGECQFIRLTPTTLGMLFELYAGVSYDEDDKESGFSREITIEELKNIHPDFESTNGCQWARSDGSYLGKRYRIKRPKRGNKVYAIQLDGLNTDSIRKSRGIRSDIVKSVTKQPCRILDTHSQIECDHKDGRYTVLSNIELSTQKESDFQPLSKAANDAKRHHCMECIKTGKRYDARKLGYKEGYIVGDEDTKVCAGCYWYDPKRFNEVISKDFVKG